ncbi:hypothetical protein VitviT2T_024936 [Vitis vinifera]|uniref:Uncharacterized protein n=1 Tax=Vitis vinifera TaxID=29760 RepID=A0ABY9DHA1_VITVI|nr:hypothetical protein VitviT2T_024936 [Vitis vinifera]
MDPANREYLTSQAIRVECESLATDAIRISVIEGSGHVCPGKLNRPPLPSGDKRRMWCSSCVRVPVLNWSILNLAFDPHRHWKCEQIVEVWVVVCVMYDGGACGYCVVLRVAVKKLVITCKRRSLLYCVIDSLKKSHGRTMLPSKMDSLLFQAIACRCFSMENGVYMRSHAVPPVVDYA